LCNAFLFTKDWTGQPSTDAGLKYALVSICGIPVTPEGRQFPYETQTYEGSIQGSDPHKGFLLEPGS
jgi:hypothetical protein